MERVVTLCITCGHGLNPYYFWWFVWFFFFYYCLFPLFDFQKKKMLQWSQIWFSSEIMFVLSVNASYTCFHVFPRVSVSFHVFPCVFVCFHVFPCVSQVLLHKCTLVDFSRWRKPAEQDCIASIPSPPCLCYFSTYILINPFSVGIRRIAGKCTAGPKLHVRQHPSVL